MDRAYEMHLQAGGWQFNGSIAMGFAENDAKSLKKAIYVDSRYCLSNALPSQLAI